MSRAQLYGVYDEEVDVEVEEGLVWFAEEGEVDAEILLVVGRMVASRVVCSERISSPDIEKGPRPANRRRW